MADLQASIEELWERRSELSPADTDAAKLVEEAIELLDTGQARVADDYRQRGVSEPLIQAWRAACQRSGSSAVSLSGGNSGRRVNTSCK